MSIVAILHVVCHYVLQDRVSSDHQCPFFPIPTPEISMIGHSISLEFSPHDFRKKLSCNLKDRPKCTTQSSRHGYQRIFKLTPISCTIDFVTEILILLGKTPLTLTTRKQNSSHQYLFVFDSEHRNYRVALYRMIDNWWLIESHLSGCFCLLPQHFGKVFGTYE